MIKMLLVFAATCTIVATVYTLLPRLKLSVLAKSFLLGLCATLLLSGLVILF